jgi:hypothetical protein
MRERRLPGRRIELTCTVAAQPPALLIWRHDNRKVFINCRPNKAIFFILVPTFYSKNFLLKNGTVNLYVYRKVNI